MTDLAEVLWKTLDFHKSHAWIKYHYKQDEKFCAVGAFRMARWQNVRCYSDLETDFVVAVLAVANEMFPRPRGKTWENVPQFNDHYATRKWMVGQVLEKAAIREDEVL